MARSSTLAPFRIRNFRFQWPADLLTSWAFEMETLILGWYVLVETNSVVMLTVFASMLYVGTLIAPLIGVMSDRVGHRNLLAGMRVVYAAVAATVMTLAFNGLLNPVLVCCLAALTGLVRPSDMGLRGAVIADFVPAPLLTSAMSIARTTGDSARIAGALTGAGLFAQFGVGRAYIAITAFYVASAALTWFAGASAAIAEPHPAAERNSPWHELREGIVYVWNTPKLLAIVWYAFLFNLTAFPITNGLLPYVAKDVYGVDQTGLGYLVASLASGALIGAIIMMRTGVTHLARVMIVSAVVWHVILVVFAQIGTLAGGIVVLMLAGVMQSLTMVCHTVLLLHASGQRYRGRAMGVRMLAIYSLPLGLLSAGALIGQIGLHTTIMLYALTGLLFTIVIAWRWHDSLWRDEAV